MHTMGASDLDMGGPATLGRVWYRVDGDKTPHYELGIASHDEIDVLILNLLSERQIDDLWGVQSADFSYQLDTEDGGRKRFRCTAYYDNQHLGVCLRAINESSGRSTGSASTRSSSAACCSRTSVPGWRS